MKVIDVDRPIVDTEKDIVHLNISTVGQLYRLAKLD